MVGISAIEQGAFVADRYRVVERLTRFAVADSTLTGVEYEYWLALDETRDVEVWLQVAESRDTCASGADLAGVVSTLRRLNHPALPIVLDFGETEVERAADDAGAEGAEPAEAADAAREPADAVVERVGYVVLEPVEAESLATVLLRGALTEAEILAVLIGIADVLKVLHEVEVVHGHLSAYSFLLAERGVLLIDLAAAAALEVASGSELTSAADVYALAWLACIAFAGVEAVEAEFGVGFDAGSSPESAAAPQLLTLELIERRHAWAEANLVATYGLRARLAALLVAALGEASGRPAVSELVGALRAREEVAEAAETEAAAVAVVEAAEAAVVAGAAIAAAEAAEAAEAVEEAEVVEQAEVAEAAQAGHAEVVEEGSVAGELVGAGVAVGVGAEAIGESGNRGRGARGGSGRGAASGLASAPLTPTASPSGRHSSPPRRPKSALYVAVAIVALVVGAIAWGCSAGGSSPSAKPAGAPTTAGQVSAGQGGAVSSPSAAAVQSSGAGTSPGASAAASPVQGSNSASPAAGGAGPSSAPGYSATPLTTAPASPGQALQQIQQTIAQAGSAGQIPQQAQSSLNQAVGTLQQEIGSRSSVQPGVSQLRAALNESAVPAGFRQQINELIPFLSIGQGS